MPAFENQGEYDLTGMNVNLGTKAQCPLPRGRTDLIGSQELASRSPLLQASDRPQMRINPVGCTLAFRSAVLQFARSDDLLSPFRDSNYFK